MAKVFVSINSGICCWIALWWMASPPAARSQAPVPSPLPGLVRQYCADCHDAEMKKGDLDLDTIKNSDLAGETEIWEKAVRKLRAGQMPPEGKKRPQKNEIETVVAWIENSLDRASLDHPNPGRTDTFRRLTRLEYQNAIRDFLALEIDAAALLPKDDASHGFDNVTVGDLSPTLLNRYIAAAQKISRWAVGTAGRSAGGETFRIPADLTQEEHVPGLPLGTRGGALISHTFPQNAEYEIQIRLTRDRNEEVEGLHEPHQLELLLDRRHVQSFTISPPRTAQDHQTVDQHLKTRIPVKAGPHKLGVTFVKTGSSLLETKRQPYAAHFNMHRHPRLTPAIYQISIHGPFESAGPGDTPSRQRIFICRPSKPEDEESSASRILTELMRRAYRRPVEAADLERPMEFYRQARGADGFEAGIEMGLSAILVSPRFLFRVERDPPGIAPRTAYLVSDLDLAARLSFFIWSSIPDDELLETAVRGDLRKPDALERQARRMLADTRSESLTRNFAEQWLHLRNLDSITPDLRLFPDFDDNLRQAFREETALLFASIVREDRSVLDLLKAEDTFLSERLAKHYGIPHVYGSRFRRIAPAKEKGRGGLLRQGSILTVTSYAHRTSPVIRGHWILANLTGNPPPPPPGNVPALQENSVSETLPVRERLAIHRANPACASCHNQMDPLGFALENFDAVGRWRTTEDGKPVDAAGRLPDGTRFEELSDLEAWLLDRPEMFVGTLTEKLLTFALGRGIEYYDAPAVRKIVREAKQENFRFSSIIAGVVKSAPFTMRRSL